MPLWIRRHVDPDEALTILICTTYLVMAWAVASDSVMPGPHDAPYARIDHTLRAGGWVISAITAAAALRLPRVCWARRWSQVLLIVMPGLCAASYGIALAASWEWADLFIPDSWTMGDPRAGGSAAIWTIALLPIMCLWIAPWDWTYLDRKPCRHGRLVKGR